MPIYEYKCADGHTFEVLQSMTDDAVEVCEVCGKPVERVFHPIAVHFKGSGFYTTDYAKKGSSDAGGGDSESKRESKPESTSETKPESKSGEKAKDSST